MFERLEPRTLLSWTDYALVGAYYDIDAFAFRETGTIQEDGTLLGELQYPAIGGPGSPFSSAWEYLDFEGPTFDVTYYEGFEPYVYDNSASFHEDYGAGWYLGDDELFSAAEIAFIVERPDDASIDDFLGDWAFSAVHMSSDVANDATVDGFHGRWSVGNASIDITATGVLGTTDSTWSIDSVDDEGFAVLDEQHHAWISDDGAIIIYADMDLADGESGFGVAVRPAASPTMTDVAGGFRVASVFSGDLALVEFGLPVVFGDTYLDLDASGTWTGYALEAWDAGDLSDPFGGTWSLEGDEVVLVDGATEDTIRYVVASNGSTLLGQRMVNDGIRDPFLAFASRDEPPVEFSPTGVSTAARDAEGRAIAYEQRTNGLWYAVDLQTRAGGEGITGEIISWISVEDGKQRVAAATDVGLLLYRRGLGETWSMQDLVQLVSGAEPITTSNVVSYQTPDQRTHLAGLNADGDLVIFSETDDNDSSPEDWTFANIADDLRSTGQTMPTFESDLIAYVTNWEGINIAGLDADGRIKVVWWAPGMENWASSDLSEITGAPRIEGGLTAYLTEWDGINIAGTDPDGNVQVTWWVPAFGGDWVVSDLSIEFEGPALQEGTVASYVTPWGGLNITGLNQQGEVVIYWWAPGMETWVISPMTGGLDAELPRPDGRMSSLVTDDGALNVFGRSEGGEVVRLSWSIGDEAWSIENLTDIAIEG